MFAAGSRRGSVFGPFNMYISGYSVHISTGITGKGPGALLCCCYFHSKPQFLSLDHEYNRVFQVCAPGKEEESSETPFCFRSILNYLLE